MDPSVVIPQVIGIGLTYAVVPTALIGVSAAFGPHVVPCPENGQDATVRVAAGRAALTLFTDARHRVCACSRWPERAGCDRACEAAISR